MSGPRPPATTGVRLSSPGKQIPQNPPPAVVLAKATLSTLERTAQPTLKEQYPARYDGPTKLRPTGFVAGPRPASQPAASSPAGVHAATAAGAARPTGTSTPHGATLPGKDKGRAVDVVRAVGKTEALVNPAPSGNSSSTAPASNQSKASLGQLAMLAGAAAFLLL
jgi:hypothetical protein